MPKQVDCGTSRSSSLLPFFFCQDGSNRLVTRACCSCLKSSLHCAYKRCMCVACCASHFIWHFLFIVTHTHIHTHACLFHKNIRYFKEFVFQKKKKKIAAHRQTTETHVPPVTEPRVSVLVPNQSNRHSTLHFQTPNSLSSRPSWSLKRPSNMALFLSHNVYCACVKCVGHACIECV